MPYAITREAALAAIEKESKDSPCLACRLVADKSTRILEITPLTTTLLSAYPRTWGQVMVVTNRHIESIGHTTHEEYEVLMQQIKKWTIRVEKVLKPLRCYVVSLGATSNQLHTCPHLHFNILPVYNTADTPELLLTWKHGLLAAHENEWQELLDLLKGAKD